MSRGALDPAEHLALLLREKERRIKERAAAVALAAQTVAELRGPQAAHPKQRAACRSVAKRRALLCTRRSGKTSGGTRERLARALERPGYRSVYCHTTRAEAKLLAWRSDTLDGWVDLVQKHGELIDSRTNTYSIGGTMAAINETDLTITFGNGSLLYIFAADDPASLEKFRGRAPHDVWIDEAQKFPGLERFCTAIVGPALRDKDGEIELSGTPSEDCSGYFYDVTKPLEHGARVPGWEVHEWSVTDNPFFGATPEARWARTAAIALVENGWTEEEPAFQREWLGRWVRTDARYVYAVHALADSAQTFAPMRLSDGWRQLSPLVRGMTPQLLAVLSETDWYDHAASLRDLPPSQFGQARQWFFGIGMDFGRDPDPVAVSVLGFTPDLPDVFEMFAWKRTMLVPDDWRCIAELLFLQISEGLVVMVGDPGGLVGAELVAWRERLGIPMEASDKAGKASWIEMMNGDIRRGRFHYRSGSPLLDEHKHLVWAPTVAGRRPKEYADRRLPDGRIPGNHNSDSALYNYRHLSAHLYRPPPPPEAQDVIEERAIEQAMVRRSDLDGLMPASMFGGDE